MSEMIKNVLKTAWGKIALVLSAWPLWKLIYNTLDAWGNMQTLIGFLSIVWRFLGSTWGTFLIMALGFALLAWQTRKQQNKSQISEETVSPCPAEWVHHIANEDRSNISKRVCVHKCEPRYDGLSNDMPYIDFLIRIFNGSIYALSIENPLEGYIMFDEQPLVGEVKIHGSSVNYFLHGDEVEFTVRQALNERAAASIRDKDRTFNFSYLAVWMKATDSDRHVIPGRLRLMSKIDKSGKPLS
jgi:hypothetical protein